MCDAFECRTMSFPPGAEAFGEDALVGVGSPGVTPALSASGEGNSKEVDVVIHIDLQFSHMGRETVFVIAPRSVASVLDDGFDSFIQAVSSFLDAQDRVPEDGCNATATRVSRHLGFTS